MAQVNKKSISLARAILAALWHGKKFNLKHVSKHPYVQLLSSDKKASTHRSTVFRLIKSNLIKIEDNLIMLTENGHQKSLLSYIETESALYKTNFFQKWDGAWRILFFDIPENKRKYRDFLRKILKRVGFKEMQRSIWAYPYPVPSFLKELICDDIIGPYIRFVTTDNLDNDTDLKKLFNLA